MADRSERVVVVRFTVDPRVRQTFEQQQAQRDLDHALKDMGAQQVAAPLPGQPGEVAYALPVNDDAFRAKVARRKEGDEWISEPPEVVEILASRAGHGHLPGGAMYPTRQMSELMSRRQLQRTSGQIDRFIQMAEVQGEWVPVFDGRGQLVVEPGVVVRSVYMLSPAGGSVSLPAGTPMARFTVASAMQYLRLQESPALQHIDFQKIERLPSKGTGKPTTGIVNIEDGGDAAAFLMSPENMAAVRYALGLSDADYKAVAADKSKRDVLVEAIAIVAADPWIAQGGPQTAKTIAALQPLLQTLSPRGVEQASARPPGSPDR